MSRCCCLSRDALVCFDLRHFGYYPAQNNRDSDGYPEECECGCHNEHDQGCDCDECRDDADDHGEAA